MTAYDPEREEPVRSETISPAADRPLSSLLSDLASETTTLVRKEVELARAEMSQKVSQMTSGAVWLAAGGMIAFAGFLYLLLSATLGLSRWVSDWLAALIVGGVVVIVGLIMLAAGRSKLSTQNLQPNRTLETLREDRDWARQQLRR